MIVANVSAIAIAGLMAGAGVVHRDPSGGLKPGAQNARGLGQKSLFAFDQKPQDLALGNGYPEVMQLPGDERKRHPAFVILRQNETGEAGAEMAGDAAGQFRHNGPAIRRQPSLPAVKHRPGAQDQVLNDVILVALEFRAFGNIVRFEDFGVADDELVVLGTAAAGLLPAILFARAGPGLFLHARGLDVRPAIQALQPRNLFAQCCVFALEPGDFLQGLYQQCLQIIETQIIDIVR